MNVLRWRSIAIAVVGQLALAPAILSASTALSNLEEDASLWGVFVDPPGNTAYFAKENVAAPALDGLSLRTAIVAPPIGSPPATPYTGIHTYRNLPADIESRFELGLDFRFDPGSSPVQALEFTMNMWTPGQRYEWAVQWENVGDGGPHQGNPPTWRLWDGASWLAFNLDQSLAANDWHSLLLRGTVQGGQVHYVDLVSDGTTFLLGQSYAPVASADGPKLAVAVQLDGNASMSPQEMWIDRVNFLAVPEPSAAVLLAAAGALVLLGRSAMRRPKESSPKSAFHGRRSLT